jgi:hypothetical protein
MNIDKTSIPCISGDMDKTINDGIDGIKAAKRGIIFFCVGEITLSKTP